MLTKTARLRSLALILLMISSGAATAQIPVLDGDRPSLAPLLKRVTPAVVNISVVGQSRAVQSPLFDDPFFRRFFDLPEGSQLPPQQSAGSGVIIDAVNGYVLTNHHVVENADEITVTLADRRRFDAELIGSDAGTDIALLRIDAPNLTDIEVGDSEALEVGDFVLSGSGKPSHRVSSARSAGAACVLRVATRISFKPMHQSIPATRGVR